MLRRSFLIWLWILLAIPATAFPWPAALNCDWQAPRLQCNFRPLAPIQIKPVALTVDSQINHPITNWQPFAVSGKESAILWLVDVSDPARGATVKKQQRLLQRWLPQLTDRHYHLGLATFADTLKTLAPLNSEPRVLSGAVEELSAWGHSTAFYQSVLNSLELLKWTKAERKSLWIFSDGMAEDTAYRHEDVVLAAQNAKIMIVGLGFPERKSQQPQLQRLQRLAKETGGYFVAAREGQLPPDTLTDILAIVDGGGSLSLDLPDLHGLHQVTLKLQDSAGEVYARTFTIEGSPRPQPTPASLVTQAAKTPSTQPAPMAFPQPSVTVPGPSIWWRWILIGSAVSVVILLLWRLAKRRWISSKRPILARFERLDSGKELAICDVYCRFGRAPGNDFCFGNDSVSAHHAELYQHRDGAFTIADLSSTNGVWINGERVARQSLRNGDLVELGEIRLRFWEVPQ